MSDNDDDYFEVVRGPDGNATKLVPVRVTRDLEPGFVKAMGTAMDMCEERA